jgi:hypothetical protein
MVAEKYVTDGVKKLFGLTRTKLRLAKEAHTLEAIPSPMPLVKLFCGLDVSSLAECKAHLKRLRDGVDYSDDLNMAMTVIQLCDIIECVKHRFEHPDYMPLFHREEFAILLAECYDAKAPLGILLMVQEVMPHSVYVGEDPPPGVRHYSRVVSGVAPLLHHLYDSAYFHEGVRLRNVKIAYAGRNILGNAVNFALGKMVD